MGTRCQIAVEGSNVMFYKHMDGYPSEVLQVLLPVVCKFYKHRSDGDELLAYIGHAFVDDFRDHMQHDQWYQSCPQDEQDMFFFSAGFAFDTSMHGDIEYLYTVMRDGSVEVKDIGSKVNVAFAMGTDVSEALRKCAEINFY